MAKYRAAVIGLGRMGSTFDDEITRGGSIYLPYCHGPSYHHSPLVDLVAGADPHDEQRTLFGERWELSSAHLYRDYNEMVSKERPDIVSVCTTARIRPQIVIDLARAGVKSIWAEKPMSFSLAEADEMVDVCREEGVALAVNCSRRWNPSFSEARRMIEGGELGEILQVTGYARCALSHNGSHLIDALRFLARGEVEWVFGEMESDEAAAGDDDLMGNGYLAFDNGVRGYVRGMPSGAGDWNIEVIGEEGRFRSSNNGLEVELVRLQSSDTGKRGLMPHSSRQAAPIPVRLPFPAPARMQGMGLNVVEDLVASIDTGSQPKCSGEDGRAALEIAIALRESHRRGGARVTLPIEDRSLKILSRETVGDEVPARIRSQMGR